MSRTTFEGYRTTTRTVAMLKEARRLYGKGYPRIVQGGYNRGGVAASAGTHDRDAMDFSVRFLSTRNRIRWEKCLWEVGFAAWRRRTIAGLWQSHIHAVPKGGDLSAGAARQVTQFHDKRDGLKGHRPYPSIGHYAYQTWEKYKSSHKHPTSGVDLSAVQRAFKTSGSNSDVKEVQAALNRAVKSKLDVDGVAGPKSRAAMAKYQSQKYGIKPAWPAKGYKPDADGIPGKQSLEDLGLKVT